MTKSFFDPTALHSRFLENGPPKSLQRRQKGRQFAGSYGLENERRRASEAPADIKGLLGNSDDENFYYSTDSEQAAYPCTNDSSQRGNTTHYIMVDASPVEGKPYAAPVLGIEVQRTSIQAFGVLRPVIRRLAREAWFRNTINEIGKKIAEKIDELIREIERRQREDRMRDFLRDNPPEYHGDFPSGWGGDAGDVA